MRSWTGVALALTEAGGDEMGSRLSTYLHPLAGRPLVWHTLCALATLKPQASRLILLTRSELPGQMLRDIPGRLQVVEVEGDDPWSALEDAEALAEGDVLLLDAAAPAIGLELQRLLRQEGEWALAAAGGGIAAALLAPQRARELLSTAVELRRLGVDNVAPLPPEAPQPALVVRDRAGLARAVGVIRDRLVERLMLRGVTFLLPQSVLVDVDVNIGRDSIIYPGVVLEGQTTIGAETVVGPGCRIIDSRIGSGVELKGWNYISRTTLRNRAIIEPYVRRGLD
ncbi:MAG TPA: hypothetical protein VGR27_05525 [Longimicrobiaceae bacterium]|nr:hypothetical protein [Longimicrobiaceae bacterium]